MISQWTNHLWQSTLFAVATALVTLAFSKNRAQVRYCLWLSASIKFLVPFALLMGLGNGLSSLLAARKIATQLAPAAVSLNLEQITHPFPDTSSFVPSAPLTHTADWIPSAVLGMWVCGFLGVVLVRFRGWLHIRAAMRASRPIDIQAVVAVRASPGFLEPGVVGFLRPILLLPEDILKRLPPSQLQAVLAHELSHIRRRDNLTAAIHMVVEAVFWFHPLVWWIGARLVEERERACDEAVLSLGSEPRDYAEAIVSVCKLYVESPLACVPGISGADLKKRIVRIMTQRLGYKLSLGRKLLLASAVLAVVGGPVLLGLLNATQVRAQSSALDWEKAAGAPLALDTTSVQLPPSPLPKCWGTGPMGPLDNDGIGLGGLAFGYSDCSVSEFIEFAYKLWLTPSQMQSLIAQLPSWAVTDRFNIRLKGPGTTTKDQKRVTMQSLLADRFKLSVHFETREMPVFALVQLHSGETGPKLQPYPDGVPCPTPPVKDLPGGIPPLCGVFGGGPGDGRVSIGGRDVTMAQIANALTQQGSGVDRPVLDQTGLTGKYDFVIVFTPSISQQYVQQIGGPTFEQALQDQLGLKLVGTTGPVDVLVIDRIEEPSPN
jgi:bla regulator protein BlaR1